MQLTEETAEWNAKELGITTEYDYMDPETNIRFGCHYLRHLIDVYGNIDTAWRLTTVVWEMFIVGLMTRDTVMTE